MFSFEIKCSESCSKIFEKFQVLVKSQAFSFTENYLLFLVFFQGVLKADLEILSDLRSSFAMVVHCRKYLSIFAKASIVLTSKVPESTSI